jgi:hypothetical protein
MAFGAFPEGHGGLEAVLVIVQRPLGLAGFPGSTLPPQERLPPVSAPRWGAEEGVGVRGVLVARPADWTDSGSSSVFWLSWQARPAPDDGGPRLAEETSSGTKRGACGTVVLKVALQLGRGRFGGEGF